jgi:hypothetical protein
MGLHYHILIVLVPDYLHGFSFGNTGFLPPKLSSQNGDPSKEPGSGNLTGTTPAALLWPSDDIQF